MDRRPVGRRVERTLAQGEELDPEIHLMIRGSPSKWNIVRHKIGIEHFVSTQRTDRTGVDRTERPQNAPVLHQCQADAQALITISRKRLCSGASPETRQAWQLVKDEVAKTEPELASCMVRECVYRGFCPEMHGCGYDKTEEYKKELERYHAIPDETK